MSQTGEMLPNFLIAIWPIESNLHSFRLGQHSPKLCLAHGWGEELFRQLQFDLEWGSASMDSIAKLFWLVSEKLLSSALDMHTLRVRPFVKSSLTSVALCIKSRRTALMLQTSKQYIFSMTMLDSSHMKVCVFKHGKGCQLDKNNIHSTCSILLEPDQMSRQLLLSAPLLTRRLSNRVLNRAMLSLPKSGRPPRIIGPGWTSTWYGC